MTAGEATREFYREQGRKQEQERIINLITKDEEVMYFLYWWYEGEYEDRLNRAIALIKGEK